MVYTPAVQLKLIWVLHIDVNCVLDAALQDNSRHSLILVFSPSLSHVHIECRDSVVYQLELSDYILLLLPTAAAGTDTEEEWRSLTVVVVVPSLGVD